jgi:hypothetical protein
MGSPACCRWRSVSWLSLDSKGIARMASHNMQIEFACCKDSQ